MLKTRAAEFGCQDACCATTSVEQQTPVTVTPDRDERCPRPHLPRKPAAAAAAAFGQPQRAAQMPANAAARGPPHADASADATPQRRRRRRRRRRGRRPCPPAAEGSVPPSHPRRNRRRRRRSPTRRVVVSDAGLHRSSRAPNRGVLPHPPGHKASPDDMPSVRGEISSRGGAGKRISRPGTDTLGFRAPPDPAQPPSRPRKTRRRCRRPTARSRAWRTTPPDERGPGFLARAETEKRAARRRRNQRRREQRRRRRRGETRCDVCGTAVCDGDGESELRRNRRWETPAEEQATATTPPMTTADIVRAYESADTGDWAALADDGEDALIVADAVPPPPPTKVTVESFAEDGDDDAWEDVTDDDASEDGLAGLAELRGELAAADGEWAVDDTASKSDECGRATRGQVAEPGSDSGTKTEEDRAFSRRTDGRRSLIAAFVALLDDSADDLLSRRNEWAAVYNRTFGDDDDAECLGMAAKLDRVIDGLEDLLDAARILAV